MKTPEPEIVQRVLRYAGTTMRTARSPCITARETIELANWITELKAELSRTTAMYVQADNEREDLQAERQTYIDLAKTAGADRVKLVGTINVLKAELQISYLGKSHAAYLAALVRAGVETAHG